MSEAPERIWLQDGGDYRQAILCGDVTWCEHPVDDADTEYIRAARIEALEAERDALREALREAQEFLSNLNEDEPSRKMPAIQASAMCIHIERKCRAALNREKSDD